MKERALTADFVLDAVRIMGSTFQKPDDDWQPTLFIEGRDGQLAIIGIVMEGEGSKDNLVRVLPQLLKQRKAVSCAIIMSAWERIIDMKAPLADMTLEMLRVCGVRNDPNRKEIVQVLHHDGTTERTWKAYINRNEKALPTLGEWEAVSLQKQEGRFGNLLHNGMNAAGLVKA